MTFLVPTAFTHSIIFKATKKILKPETLLKHFKLEGTACQQI